MSEQDDNPLSPTVAKVLDEYLEALIGDKEFQDEAAKRLDELLRNGKIPKFDEIDAALAPSLKGEQS
jgi:hypothetical protein